MVVNSLFRWLRGYVVFTATGKFPERLINLAMLSNITLINPVGGKGELSAQVSPAEYKMLYNIRKRTMTRLKITKKVGLPFIINRNKQRGGLIAGLVLFFVIINVMSMFLWSIDIKGNSQVSTYQVQKTLQDNGVYVGALKNNINVSQAERGFDLELGKVGWMSINIVGSTASVELSESYDVPEIVDKTKPCNLKAIKSGQIIKMDVREGQNCVSIGDGVAKGQLLASGIVEIGETGRSRFVHSEGEIFAGVRTQEKVVVSKQQMYKSIKRAEQRQTLSMLGLNIPLCFKQTDNVFSRRIITESLCLNERTMPINIITEQNYKTTAKKVSVDKSSAEKSAAVQFALNDIFCRWDSDIKSKHTKTDEDKNSYIITADYYCIENIAEAVPIEIVN